MLHQSLFHYNEYAPLGLRPAIPAVSFEPRPTLERSFAELPSNQEACEFSDESTRRRHVADRLGTLVTRMEDSGVMTLLIAGTATWPGVVATASRIVIHVTQTAGTYHRVRRSGFTGGNAVAQTAWWSIIGR